MKGLTLVLCLGFAQLAHAQVEDGAYVGASVGAFDYDSAVLGISDDTFAYQLFGGYRLSDHFAVEGGIGRTGDIKGKLTLPFFGIGEVDFDAELIYDIYTARAVGFLLFDEFSAFGAAGYFSAAASGPIRSSDFGEVRGGFSGHQRGATAMFGIQHDFRLDWSSLSIRGQYEWYDFDDDIDASSLSVSVLFRF